MPNPCPSLEALEQLLAGQSLDGVRAHVNGCLQCQALLERVTGEQGSGLLSALDPTPVAKGEPALAALLNRLRQTPPATDLDGGQKAGAAGDGLAALQAALSKLGPFQIVRPLGSGATSHVFLARDTQLDRLVAVKALRPELACLPSVQARFLREARAAASLRHDHIVNVHQVLHALDCPPCLVMEYVAGESLGDCLKREALLPPARAAGIVEQVALGLAAAHERGLVHRDIKPSNILLDEASGRAKIADFGLVCHDDGAETMTADGQILGTPAYMSPEQASGQSHRVDARSDLFSLGAVLYQLLAGRPPFAGSTRDLLYQVVHEDPLPPRRLRPDVPRDLETVTLQCLAKAPARRYPSAQELAADLERWRNGQPVRARPVSVAERLWRWGRRRALVLGLAAAALGLMLIVGVALVIIVIQQVRQRQATALAAQRDQLAAQRDQLIALQRLGTESLSVGETQQARAHLLKALPIAEALSAAQPTNGQAREDLIFILHQLGEASEDDDDAAAAERWLSRARDVGEDWLRLQPRSAAARRALAKACQRLALAENVDLDETLALQRRAVRLLEEAHQAEPADRPTKRALVEAYLGLADFLDADGDPGAAELFGKFDKLLRELEKGTTASAERADLLLLRGRALALRGEHEAVAAVARALLQLPQRDGFIVYEAACCYAQCVAALERKHPDGLNPSQKELRKKYADQAFEQLRQALAAGSVDPWLLKIDPDWEPLRKDPEFRRLQNRNRNAR